MREIDDQRPWYYRVRLTNWLMAQPWRWHYRVIYRSLRVESRHPRTGKLLVHGEAHGRLRSAWLALTFPHVHHESEE